MRHFHSTLCVALLSLPVAATQLPQARLAEGRVDGGVLGQPALHPWRLVQVPTGLGANASPPAGDARDVVVRGVVLDERREPARGSVVVSDQGGLARVAEDGSFELAVERARPGRGLRISGIGPEGTLGQVVVPVDGDGVGEPIELQLASGGTCSPEWLPTFDIGYGDPNEAVIALQVFDDGSGPALYVGGGFTSIGSQPIQFAARFDGQGWEQVGAPGGWILDFEIYDNGTGPALYAAGSLEGGIVRWDGTDWQSVPGEYGGVFECLAVFDDGMGRGPMLYGGGYQILSGATNLRPFAVRTDGTVVEDFGFDATEAEDFFNRVSCMEVYDGGTGPALYIGGRFELNTAIPARNLVYLKNGSIHGVEWASSAPFTDTKYIFDMHWWKSGDISVLVVAGNLKHFPLTDTATYVYFDGVEWAHLIAGSNVDGYFVTSFDAGDGEGNCLVINGNFASINGKVANGSARLTTRGWEPMGAEFSFVARDTAAFDGGEGAQLYTALYPNAPAFGGYSMLRWKPTVWSPVRSNGMSPNGWVLDLLVHDDGSGPALYAAGGFAAVGDVAAAGVARYDGTVWSALESGLNGTVYDLETFDSPAGLRLIAGGNFSIPSGGQNLAAWDGISWSSIGPTLPGPVYAARAVDGAWIGSGQTADRLYVTGSFVLSGGGGGGGGDSQIRNITYLTSNNQWVRIGNGLDAAGRALALMEEAGLVSLFVGGDFTQAGLLSANRVARLQLATAPGSPGMGGGNQLWSVLGTGTNGPVRSLAVFDGGAGERLYAGGQFTSAGGVAAQNLASFANGLWEAPAGLTGPGAIVERLHVHDDGRGAALYAAGDFDFAGGGGAHDIARFSGAAWSALGGGLGGAGRALASFAPAGGSPDLFAGGNFDSQPDTGDRHMARWSCVPGSAFTASAGCSGNPNLLEAQCLALSVGQSCQLSLTSPQTQGIALLYLGTLGVDGGGCGLVVPGLGELLLSIGLPTTSVGVAPGAGGLAQFSLGVPNNPGLMGIAVAFQAAHVATGLPGLPISMSNALATVIAP